MELLIAATDLAKLHTDLLATAPEEGAAFVSTEPSRGQLVVRSWRVFKPSDFEDGFGELTLTEVAQLDGMRVVKAGGHCLVEAHSHPGTSGPVSFSSFDNGQLPEFARYVRHKLPGRPFGALVFGHDSVDGQLWTDVGVQPLQVRAVGESLAIPAWASGGVSNDATFDARFDRQMRALGPEGQCALSALRVAVVGAGGTGSQVVQQLAHLGVAAVDVIDPDIVETSNLSRLAGGAWWDVVLHRKKTAVARRLVRRVRRGVSVRVAGELRSTDALAILQDRDLIIGCVDNDGARLILTELAAAHLIPYLDIGVGIEGHEAASIGGRVAFHFPGGACLACADELDFTEVAEDLEPPALREIRVARGYARDRRIEPALMPLNTVLAGLAMEELLAYVSGVRPVVPFLRYDMLSQRVIRQNVDLDSDCAVCGTARGMGDRQRVERYVQA